MTDYDPHFFFRTITLKDGSVVHCYGNSPQELAEAVAIPDIRCWDPAVFRPWSDTCT